MISSEKIKEPMRLALITDLQSCKYMVVSRGLARETTMVPRIFNHPELVCIELVPEVGLLK